MSTTEMMKPIPVPASHLSARAVAIYYVITFLAGAFILTFQGRLAFTADLLVGLFYLMVTALLYGLSRTVRTSRSPRPDARGSASQDS